MFFKKPQITIEIVNKKTFNVNVLPAKKKIGITFGAFDPLHYGHIRLFENAKRHCDVLIVCVSTKEYIEKNKRRKERVSYAERVNSLKAIKHVDHIDMQGMTFGKKELVQKWKPDVMFVGSDWGPETFKGEGLGVPVVYLARTPNISSTKLDKMLSKKRK